MKTINVVTSKKNQMINITQQVQEALAEVHIKDGACMIFTPHTTAAITINEQADPDVQKDMCLGLSHISPSHDFFKHFEGNSDAHIKSSLVGVSEWIMVENHQLVLGTWQGIYFCEFDGPRNRKVHIKFL